MTTPKTLAVFIAAYTLTVPAFAQASRPSVPDAYSKFDTTTLLRDAEYILNRYGELSTQIMIDLWHAPPEFKAVAKRAKKAVDRNVELEKPQLSAMLARQDWTSTELLDVYCELLEVSSELADLQNQSGEYGDSQQVTSLAALSSNAQITAAKLYSNLRAKLQYQEAQLAACGSKRKATVNP